MKQETLGVPDRWLLVASLTLYADIAGDNADNPDYTELQRKQSANKRDMAINLRERLDLYDDLILVTKDEKEEREKGETVKNG